MRWLALRRVGWQRCERLSVPERSVCGHRSVGALQIGLGIEVAEGGVGSAERWGRAQSRERGDERGCPWPVGLEA